MVLTTRQQEIIELLSRQPTVPAGELCQQIGLTRARLQQIVAPLITSGQVRREGAARATVYLLGEQRSEDQLRRENWELRRRIQELSRELEDRKVIERAKELLIANFDIPPTEAYRKLQQQSMNSGRSLRQIADGIIGAYEG